ncbi:hypothetical protein A2797_00305 [candidate division WWE3 bacterium RIFCSPHIGHO2_01_FULL_48_15]|uniref:Uncharacterized protein n=1 Tax=candidate division WWE3 bacterium RIFCSPHIGHO2_01_FULL_48_15 TaxID=1802619 RepID=A0A1F4VCE5_UNCKA|nr:MAG: hypothetical protein A2797_00305 [candidate division WWE3 bacterium RIFCSPHIGHO2_01_FULL_48_15]
MQAKIYISRGGTDEAMAIASDVLTRASGATQADAKAAEDRAVAIAVADDQARKNHLEHVKALEEARARERTEAETAAQEQRDLAEGKRAEAGRIERALSAIR